jgi:ABC-type nickel/cobalt efflux system permease component RcnA
MGLAGGLVPSPSALIVLLGAIALGRTVFGIGLVLAYGIGMAGTLTTVGYLVAKLPGRLGGMRMRVAGTRLGPILAAGPVLTAIIVLFVGIALALRSAGPLV